METAKEKYLEIVIAQEEEEKISNARREEYAQKALLDAEYEDAHISGIESLFEVMFLEDSDAKKLLPIGPTQINELKDEYREKFEIVIDELKYIVLKRSKDKKEEIASLQLCMKNVRNETDMQGRKRLDEFMHAKKEVRLCEL
jgi:glutathionylspermidine synthase